MLSVFKQVYSGVNNSGYPEFKIDFARINLLLLISRIVGIIKVKKFPYVALDDLRMDLMDKVRNLAKSRKPDHDWLQMSEQDILKIAGLWEKDFSSGVQFL